MQPYIGQVILYPVPPVPPEERPRVPTGWLLCDGQRIPISENDALFQLLGDRFGGDGETFNLPDLSAKAPRGLGYLMAAVGAFPI